MVIIRKYQTPKTPHPGRVLLRGVLTYIVHMGKSCADGVMCYARDL